MDYMKEKDASLAELRDEIRQLRAQEEDPGGMKALREDVRVCKALVGAARKTASEKNFSGTQSAVGRLVPALISLRATLPASRMAEEIERALQALVSFQPQEAQNVASRSLLRATDIAMKAPPTLAPTVIKDTEAAKSQVDKSNLVGARNGLLDLLKRLNADDSALTADHALAAARMTQSALDLGAGGVVQAQLDYLDQLLTGLQQKIEGALTPLEPAQPEQGATGAAEAYPATGSVAAQPAPAQPTAPAAVPR
jgi:hypothetical protein